MVDVVNDETSNVLMDLWTRAMAELVRRAVAGDDKAVAAVARLTGRTEAQVRDEIDEVRTRIAGACPHGELAGDPCPECAYDIEDGWEPGRRRRLAQREGQAE